jgi:hypothetical protein
VRNEYLSALHNALKNSGEHVHYIKQAVAVMLLHVDAMDFYLMEVILSREVQKPNNTISNNKKSPKQPTTDTDAPVKVAGILNRGTKGQSRE